MVAMKSKPKKMSITEFLTTNDSVTTNTSTSNNVGVSNYYKAGAGTYNTGNRDSNRDRDYSRNSNNNNHGNSNSAADSVSSWRQSTSSSSNTHSNMMGQDRDFNRDQNRANNRFSNNSRFNMRGDHSANTSTGTTSTIHNNNLSTGANTLSNKPKSNPFGNASAVDTASKLAALESKQQSLPDVSTVTETTNVTTSNNDDNNNNSEHETAVDTNPENTQSTTATDNNNNTSDSNNTNDNGITTEQESSTNTSNNNNNNAKPERRERRERKRREPKVLNSRAAALGDAPAPKPCDLKRTGTDGPRDRDREDYVRDRDRNTTRDRAPPPPPPILNERFAKLALEEKEKLRSSNRNDRSSIMENRDLPSSSNHDTHTNNNTTAPPLVQNSRFTKAIEADETYIRPSERYERERERPHSSNTNTTTPPPPLVQNSRFAAAAAELEAQRQLEVKEREERRAYRANTTTNHHDNNYNSHNNNNNDLGPPPIPTNSRFAAVAADHAVEKEREMKEREERRMNREREYLERGGSGRGGGDDRYSDRIGRGGRGGVTAPGGGDRLGRWNSSSTTSAVDPFPPLKTKTEFIAPELPKHLQVKKEPEKIIPVGDVVLTLPGEDEEAAKARILRKKQEAEEKAEADRIAAEKEAEKKAEEEAAAAEKAAKAASLESDLLASFSSGDRLGKDLLGWCLEQKTLLPSVEKLVYDLLTVREKRTPNPECEWAKPDQYGAALLSLVKDNVLSQMEVLWGIQKYCSDQGFPKIKDEYLVQSMFRAMYKYDLTDAEAFDAWKEDESAIHNEGKGKAIIQTMDWFAWLEEDDEEEEDGSYYDEEEEEEE